ncbi:hypothetical protein P5G63_03055 [Aeromonas salmonicida]|uniref:hypothetical protein n=1 Tax=Aeromonas salmonicida TaxID=645 RepID=UPI002240E120|nr:hypothetical protein [Aeromonas salmonicida]MDF8327522.1 hypothetical protein [Aeromonas salmonicida]
MNNFNMPTVYITESNLNAIAQDITGAITDTRSVEQLYEFELRSFLAIPEMKRLSSVKLILESLDNPDILFKIIQFNEHPKIRQRKDPKSRWIFLGGSPAYHMNNDCARLKSEYKNYDIPVQIPSERVEEYRRFFIENIDMFERNQEVFYANAEFKFNVKINGVKKVQARNSGSETLENFKLKSPSQLLQEINKHVEKMQDFRLSNEVLIAKCCFNTHKVLENPSIMRLTEQQIELVRQWHNYKAALKRLVVQHLTLKFNVDFGFSGELLDSFGLRKCSACFTEIPSL